jgi:hypothetical protein
MSTLDEIREVYESDIDHKTNIVRQRQGIEAFLPRNMVKGTSGFQVFNIVDPDITCLPREVCRSRKARPQKSSRRI